MLFPIFHHQLLASGRGILNLAFPLTPASHSQNRKVGFSSFGAHEPGGGTQHTPPETLSRNPPSPNPLLSPSWVQQPSHQGLSPSGPHSHLASVDLGDWGAPSKPQFPPVHSANDDRTRLKGFWGRWNLMMYVACLEVTLNSIFTGFSLQLGVCSPGWLHEVVVSVLHTQA